MRKLWLIGYIKPITLELEIKRNQPLIRKEAIHTAIEMAKAGYYTWIERHDTGAVAFRASPTPEAAASLALRITQIQPPQSASERSPS